MHETFTPELNPTYCKTDQNRDKMNEFSPRETTLEFIKQFARAYNCDSSSCNGLCGYVAN